jgi:hypothetical protein
MAVSKRKRSQQGSAASRGPDQLFPDGSYTFTTESADQRGDSRTFSGKIGLEFLRWARTSRGSQTSTACRAVSAGEVSDPRRVQPFLRGRPRRLTPATRRRGDRLCGSWSSTDKSRTPEPSRTRPSPWADPKRVEVRFFSLVVQSAAIEEVYLRQRGYLDVTRSREGDQTARAISRSSSRCGTSLVDSGESRARDPARACS